MLYDDLQYWDTLYIAGGQHQAWHSAPQMDGCRLPHRWTAPLHCWAAQLNLYCAGTPSSNGYTVMVTWTMPACSLRLTVQA